MRALAAELVDPLYRFTRVFRALERVGAKVTHGDTWLDLGCHNGTFLNRVIARYPVDAVGVDSYDPTLKGQEPWKYVRQDLNQELALGRRFHFISALEILEHIIDTDRFLGEIGRHQEAGGYLVITTPNINSLRNRLTVPFGRYPNGLEYRNLVHHVRLYNVPTLTGHVGEYGYRIEHIGGVSFLPVRLNHLTVYRRLSELFADLLPQLCGNILLIARRTPEDGTFERPR